MMGTAKKKYIAWSLMSSKYMKKIIGHIINERCQKIVLKLFKKDQERGLKNVRTTIYKDLEQTTITALFTLEADKLLINKIDKLAKSEIFAQGHVCDLSKLLNFMFTGILFV